MLTKEHRRINKRVKLPSASGRLELTVSFSDSIFNSSHLLGKVNQATFKCALKSTALKQSPRLNALKQLDVVVAVAASYHMQNVTIGD